MQRVCSTSHSFAMLRSSLKPRPPQRPTVFCSTCESARTLFAHQPGNRPAGRRRPHEAGTSLAPTSGGSWRSKTLHSSTEHILRRWAHTTATESVSAPASQQTEIKPDVDDPYKLVQGDMASLAEDIKAVILEHLDADEVKALSTYHFDGKGKAIRPLVVLLAARCINNHLGVEGISRDQRDIAMIAEMIHTASLIHDDVIDESDVRRGRPTLSKLCGQKKAILIGDCVLAISSLLLARIGHADVYRIISRILTDLVQGEFMQMECPAARKTQAERFAHYLEKTYKKTASLMARPCEAVGVVAGLSPQMQEIAFHFGRNLGMAFQLVDDLLDFQADASQLGKPAVNDLRSGIATAPVLFAAEEHPELYEMINRRFQNDGDVEAAFSWVVDRSDAILRSQQLARSHAQIALRHLEAFKDSPYRRGLEIVIENVLIRRK